MDNPVETVDISDGHSLIDVRGGEHDSVLLVDRQPIALHWCDGRGSIGQYMVRAGITDCEDKLRGLRYVLNGGFQPHLSLSSQIYPFLQLFVPDRYRVQYHATCTDHVLMQFKASWAALRDYDQFYPFGHALVFTQAVDALHPDRVAYHLNRIRDGQRPIALTATVEEGLCEFVIDGHHKLSAYEAANVKPHWISVCRLDAPQLAADAFSRYIGARHPKAKHYRKVKRWFAG